MGGYIEEAQSHLVLVEQERALFVSAKGRSAPLSDRRLICGSRRRRCATTYRWWLSIATTSMLMGSVCTVRSA